MNNTTIVTGLWDIKRHNRSFDVYIEAFQKFLSIPQNLYIYVPEDLEDFVWQHRSPDNTTVKVFGLDDVRRMYDPFWDKTQEIRTSEDWINGAGWLSDSPQCKLEWYNPIVQSKMFMLNDAAITNPFNTDYFYWADAGLTNTVPEGHLTAEPVLDSLHTFTSEDEFMFISFPYNANEEIHGFTYPDINDYAGEDVKYVCRGGLFGGHKKAISVANAEYYAMLNTTLHDGYMGTEEAIFSIMAHNDPYTYRRFEIEENGLIVKFTQDVIEGNAKLANVDGNFIKSRFDTKKIVPDNITDKVTTNVYMLTFNMPEQLTHTINTMIETEGLLTHPNLFIFDNSTDEEAMKGNKEIADKHGFEYIHLGGNTGICGGRQRIAEHFHESDADYMMFFEDDMTFNTKDSEGEFCRNGFRKYISNIYETIHKIIYVEEFDFLKLSFTEVYFDNDKQCAWYNVPQSLRDEYWPDYNKLPKHGLDPNCPKTEFNTINTIDGLAYITGDVYYGNWPMIVSKAGNKKMFIDTKWDHPYEQTWMSHMLQQVKEGKLLPAILLASPIWHDRIKFYEASERVES
tara:strand:- start:3641 stop:5347 length:1707 start_codon:yes stop_codon:yes gene_type:complete